MGQLSNYKTKIVTNCLENKLNINFRSGNERTGWYYLANKKIIRIIIPKVHGGESTITKRVVKNIRNSLRLTNEEFADLYNCPMRGSDYKQKIENLVNSNLL